MNFMCLTSQKVREHSLIHSNLGVGIHESEIFANLKLLGIITH